jgi:hypothetical protein
MLVLVACKPMPVENTADAPQAAADQQSGGDTVTEWTDASTGCVYLIWQAITPKLDKYGRPICGESSQ